MRKKMTTNLLVLVASFQIFVVAISLSPGFNWGVKRINVPSSSSSSSALQGATSEEVATPNSEAKITRNFITNIIEDDIAKGRNGGRVLTRFPPEPNGYLHLGHAKSILFNFGVAKAYNGATNMRFDDTNPEKEETEYVEAIKDDVRWLVAGDTKAVPAPWNDAVRHASDYFETLYAGAEHFIMQGKAYVEELSAEEMREYRGTLTEPGRNSPHRDRSVEENLALFRKMRSGQLPDGACVLRAKIDMSSPNMNLRDPTLYRIKHAEHPMTGNAWPIYPMYDYAHAVSDAIEGISHSLCTLEFADHRPLYDWVIDGLLGSGILPPHCSAETRPVQTEFSRLNLQYTVLSKRKLIQLVKEKHVDGWDDPRMPTICGVRRRGIPSDAVKLFCDRVAISKADQNIDMGLLEDCAREVLDKSAPRAFAVLDPLKVTITNYPDGQEEIFETENHPKDASMGTRQIPFSREVYIDRDDFFDTGPEGSIRVPKGYKRLVLGGDVRLRLAYVITCDEVVRDPSTGEVLELKCTYDERSRAGITPEGAKRCKGIVQWVDAKRGITAEIRLYDRLFLAPTPGKDHDGDFVKDINPDSLRVARNALVEPSVSEASCLGQVYQFERAGYFCVDPVDNYGNYMGGGNEGMKFNRVVTLRDAWGGGKGKEGANQKQGGKAGGGKPENTPPVDDYRRVEFRVGKVVGAERHPDADSLLIEQIDCGDESGPRTVVSGLAKHIDPEKMVGKRIVVIANLKPSKMRGVVSEAMVLCSFAGEGADEVVELLEAPEGATVGEVLTMEGMAPPQPDEVLKSKTAQECLKRVLAKLSADKNGQVVWTDDDGSSKRLLCSRGPMMSPTLKDCQVG